MADTKIKIGADTSQVSRADKDIKGLGGSLKNVSGLAKGLGAAFAGKAVFDFFAAGVKSANEFETSVAEVNTLLGKTAPIEKYASAAEKMALTYGGTAKSQMQSFYDVVSAGFSDVEQGSKVLEQANKLAVAGVTDVGTAVDGLTSVLNAYGLSADDAERVSDVMFTTVKGGKTTVEELSAAVGKVAPLAAAMGVSFEEVGAALATTTASGINTSESVSGLKAAFANILKPTKMAADEAARLGIEFNAQALEAKGLVPFLQDVQDKTGGNTESMGKLFGSVEALNTILALLSGDLQSVKSNLEATTSAVGATDEAMEIMADTSALAAQRASAAWDTFMRTVGGANAVVDTHRGFLDQVADGLNRVSGALGNTAAQEAHFTTEVEKAEEALRNNKQAIEETEARLAEYGERTIWNARQIQDHEDALVKLNEELVENEDKLLEAKDSLNQYTDATGQADEAAADFVGPLQQTVEVIEEQTEALEDNTVATEENTEATGDNVQAIEVRNDAWKEEQAQIRAHYEVLFQNRKETEEMTVALGDADGMMQEYEKHLEETTETTKASKVATETLGDVVRDARDDWNSLSEAFGFADTKLGKTVDKVLSSISAFENMKESIGGLAESFNKLVGWAGKFLDMDFKGIAGGFGGGDSIIPGGGGGGGGGLGGLGGGALMMNPMTAAIIGGISGLVSGLIGGDGYDGPGVDEEHEHQRLTAQTSINEIQTNQELHHQLRVVLQEINVERRGNFADLINAVKGIETITGGSKEAVKESTVQITATSKDNTQEVVETAVATTDSVKATVVETAEKAVEEGTKWNQELIDNIDISTARMYIKQGDIEKAVQIVGEEEVERLTALIEQEKVNAEMLAEEERASKEAIVAAEEAGVELLREAEAENTQIIKEAEETAAQLIAEVETENAARLEAAQKEGTEVVAEVTKENTERMLEAQAEVAAMADETAKQTAANLESAEIRAAELIANSGATGDAQIVSAVVASGQATANAVSGVVSRVSSLANDVASYKKRYDEEQASSRASTQSASGNTVFDIFADMDDANYDEEMSDADLAKKIARLRNTVGTHDAYYADNVDSVTKERVGPSLSQRLNYRELEKLEEEARNRNLSEEDIDAEEQKVIDRDVSHTKAFAELNYDEADYDDKIASRNRAINRREKQLDEEELATDPAYQKLVAELKVLEEGKANLDVGSDYIPKDMLANIHKGEMIFNPSESDMLRKAVIGRTQTSGGSMGGVYDAQIMGQLQVQTNLIQRFTDIMERFDGDGLPAERPTVTA